MKDSCIKIGKVYNKLGMKERFKCEFYDNKHEFNRKMQEDAFEWFCKWLKN